jgi:LysR family glycine cleavage system transcriptional activator
VALESSTIAASHIEAGRLQPMFDLGRHLPVKAHFLVCPPRHEQRHEVAQFLGWLQGQAGPPL